MITNFNIWLLNIVITLTLLIILFCLVSFVLGFTSMIIEDAKKERKKAKSNEKITVL